MPPTNNTNNSNNNKNNNKNNNQNYNNNNNDNEQKDNNKNTNKNNCGCEGPALFFANGSWAAGVCVCQCILRAASGSKFSRTLSSQPARQQENQEHEQEPPPPEPPQSQWQGQASLLPASTS